MNALLFFAAMLTMILLTVFPPLGVLVAIGLGFVALHKLDRVPSFNFRRDTKKGKK